ncbi:Dynein heavy chain domain-containing protein 1 [Holothuria leucospilota]|uniref:Dynein heavy chain domain-containing protein 1 n=1 Tax=Holothuria leucospilota TaxID=206669 RepID=A0A9Q1BE38_HOLLE|nr:Dynein heavy chain domain-containing protein 1 [Holothuria leucospilota]
MLVSPHLADLQPAAELWRSTLWQVSELVELLQECQAKEIMKAIVADPKVLSILNKRKGQKGWRELQGDNLKDVLLSVIQTEEELLHELDHHLTDARLSYPRFFFLSDSDLIDLLAHPSDRHQWVPFIRKLFPGIREVTLALTSDPYGIQSQLDLQLHADKLGAVAVRGDLNEDIKLVRPVAATSSLCKWWSSFEVSVKSTVGSILQACLEARLQDGASGNPEAILEELASFEGSAGYTEEQQDLKQAVKKSFSHWLLRFPSQCVLVGEAVLWFRQMEKVLKGGDKEDLEKARDKLQKRLSQYTGVLRDNVRQYLNSPSRARLHILLSNLLMQTLHHRDIVEGLLKLSNVDNTTFDWQKALRYSMDISTTICVHNKKEAHGSTSVETQYLFGLCHVNQLRSSFPYDYEYLGPALRLVSTPLTERCHLALTNAMKGFECGTVLGQSSSGKTESVKDLSQAMGRNLLIVECTGINNVRTLNSLLCGMIQTGSWGLLENPQSMGQGLMSVLAQQLQHIVHAYQVLHNEKYDDTYSRRGKSTVKHLRRHSVTTLHPVSSDVIPKSAKEVREKIFITARVSFYKYSMNE